MEIILASASPRRQELLALVTQDYRVYTTDVDEAAISAPTPALLAQRLAQAKAQAAGAHFPAALVIGCDTVVDVDGRVFGKPASKEAARTMLTALSDRSHLVHTGVCLWQANRVNSFYETTKVSFSALHANEIEAYICTKEPYDKAGGYGIQGLAAKFIYAIEGCFFNVMGLPVARLYEALKQSNSAL